MVHPAKKCMWCFHFGTLHIVAEAPQSIHEASFVLCSPFFSTCLCWYEYVMIRLRSPFSLPTTPMCPLTITQRSILIIGRHHPGLLSVSFSSALLTLAFVLSNFGYRLRTIPLFLSLSSWWSTKAHTRWLLVEKYRGRRRRHWLRFFFLIISSLLPMYIMWLLLLSLPFVWDIRENCSRYMQIGIIAVIHVWFLDVGVITTCFGTAGETSPWSR